MQIQDLDANSEMSPIIRVIKYKFLQLTNLKHIAKIWI